MGRIKVIHIITRFDKGGSAEDTFQTVRGLNKDRYDLTMIKGPSFESDMGPVEVRAVQCCLDEVAKSSVRVITIPELIRSIHPVRDINAFLKLMKIFKEEKPHIVHTHTSKAGFLGRWAALFAGVPAIMHTPHGHVFWGYFGKWQTRLYVFLERLTATITHRIITVTDQEKKDHLLFQIAREDKFTVIHSGVELGRFYDPQIESDAMRDKLGIDKDAFVIGTVGRLTHIKGHKYLIDAARKIVLTRPNIIFMFLGDGELLDDLKSRAASLGIYDSVRFLGWRQDVAEVMSTFDIFALPSLNEGMGKVLVEAMAMGKPIIASDVGGIRDLVKHEVNGLLVPSQDADAIARSILELHNHPAKLREMGEKGKAMAADYSVESMVEKIDKLYTELVGDFVS
ncbi:MAG TPA: glycosyltransferase family 4 protein [Syntrophales bacterium]|nr:glycosyltransferase family 4 protein [Syntrophales bacterium]